MSFTPWQVEWVDPNTFDTMAVTVGATDANDALRALRALVTDYDFGYKFTEIIVMAAMPSDSVAYASWMVNPSDVVTIEDIPDAAYEWDAYTQSSQTAQTHANWTPVG